MENNFINLKDFFFFFFKRGVGKLTLEDKVKNLKRHKENHVYLGGGEPFRMGPHFHYVCWTKVLALFSLVSLMWNVHSFLWYFWEL